MRTSSGERWLAPVAPGGHASGMPPPVASAERFLGVRLHQAGGGELGHVVGLGLDGGRAAAAAVTGDLVGGGRRVLDDGGPGRRRRPAAEPKAPGTLSSSEQGRLGRSLTRRAPSTGPGASSSLTSDCRPRSNSSPVGDGVEVGAGLLGELVELLELGQRRRSSSTSPRSADGRDRRRPRRPRRSRARRPRPRSRTAARVCSNSSSSRSVRRHRRRRRRRRPRSTTMTSSTGAGGPGPRRPGRYHRLTVDRDQVARQGDQGGDATRRRRGQLDGRCRSAAPDGR